MIEGLKMIDEKVGTANPVEPTVKMTDVIRSYNEYMDTITEKLYSAARLLVGENMRFSYGDFPSPECLMEDVKLLGERIKAISELCNIIGGCL